MPSTKWPTALAVIQDACAQLALPVPVAAASATDDVLGQQMLALLNWCGRKLVKPTGGMRWQALQKTWPLTTIPGTTLYDLPDDWDSFQDLTGWNTSTRIPMAAPGTPTWATLKAMLLGPTTFALVYRVRGNQFELYASPSAPQTLAIDYGSRSWAIDKSTPAPTYRDKVLNDADFLVYDNELITAKLKLQFLQAKGFDTTVAQMEYNELEEQALNADQTAEVLHMGGGGGGIPLLSDFNLPMMAI